MSHASPIQFAPSLAKSPPSLRPARTGADGRFAALLAARPDVGSAATAVTSSAPANDSGALAQVMADPRSGLPVAETGAGTAHASKAGQPGSMASRRKTANEEPAVSPSAAVPAIILTALAQAGQTLPIGSSARADSARFSLKPFSAEPVGPAHAAGAEPPSTSQATGREKAAGGPVAPDPGASRGGTASEPASPVAHQLNAVAEDASRGERRDEPPAVAAVIASAAAPVTLSAPIQSAPIQSASGPSAQIAPVEAPALAQVSTAVAGLTTSSSDGTQSVTVHLKPEELGAVRIQIDQTAAGTAHVAITAERPETLQLLRHDQPGLMRALDQAGVPSDARTVSFQVEPSVATSRSGGTGTGPDTSGRGQNDGSARRDDDPASNSGQDQRQSRARWLRAGLDITA